MGAIEASELGFNETFEKIERLANLLEEINSIVCDLKENEDIEICFKIELV